MSAVSATLEGPSEQAPARPAGGTAAPRWAFWLLVLFLVLEYARPPVVVQFKLQMLIVLLLPLAWLRSGNRRPHPILLLQAAFLFWCMKAIPFASNYYAVYYVSRILFANVAIALALSWVGSERIRLRPLIWVWLGVMTYQALWAVTHGGRGTGGFLGDENDLALACNTAFAFAFAGFVSLRGRVRWISAAVGLVLVVGVVASFSRGGFVGLAALSAYLWWTAPHKLRNLGIALAGALALLAVAPQDYLDEIQTITDTDRGTAQGRRFLWTAAFNMWTSHPIAGVGGGNVAFLVGSYQPTEGFDGREYVERNWSGTTVHSLFFELLAEQGLVGVVLFGAIAWLHLSNVRRTRRRVREAPGVPIDVKHDADFLGVGLAGAVVGYLATGMFLSVLYYPYLWYFSGLGVAYGVVMEREIARARAAGGAGAAGDEAAAEA